MNRYNEIEEIVYKEIEKNCFGSRKKHGYRHLFGVSTLCLQLSYLFHLDSELCAIMGLLHDFSVYKNNNRFNHAFMSSQLAKQILEQSSLFEPNEIDIIVKAIYNHSSKDRIDDEYSELLKLCDVIESYLHEPDIVVDKNRQRYLNIAKEKKII